MVEWPNKNQFDIAVEQFDRAVKLMKLEGNAITLLKCETVSKYQVDMGNGVYISAIGKVVDAMKIRRWFWFSTCP